MKLLLLPGAPIVITLILTVATIVPSIATAQNTPPGLPVIVTPGNFSQVSDNPPTFTAIAAADAEGDPQQLQVAIYMDDTLFVMGSDWLGPLLEGDTLTWTAPDTLHENWFYFWTARATDGTDTTPQFGHLAFFIVNAVNEPPTAPDLIAPVADSTVFTVRPEFHWTQSVDPDFYDSLTYTLYVSLNDCLMTFIAMDLLDTMYQDTMALGTGWPYAWSVEAVDDHGGRTAANGEWFWTYLPGDVDGSRTKTAADLIAVVNYVFKGSILPVPDCVVDFNGDGMVTAADLIAFVNHFYKGFAPPEPACDL